MDPIQPSFFSRPLKPISQLTPQQLRTNNPKPEFTKELGKAVKQLSDIQHQAQQTVQNYAVGKQNAHQVMLAVHHADLSLKLAVGVRNKAIEAYQDIMRTSM